MSAAGSRAIKGASRWLAARPEPSHVAVTAPTRNSARSKRIGVRIESLLSRGSRACFFRSHLASTSGLDGSDWWGTLLLLTARERLYSLSGHAARGSPIGGGGRADHPHRQGRSGGVQPLVRRAGRRCLRPDPAG